LPQYDHFLSAGVNELLKNSREGVVSRVARSLRSLPFLTIILSLRRATARLRTLPSVFIIGATKSGTTSLTSVVWNHPAHVEPLDKELMYLQQLPGYTPEPESNRLSNYLWGPYHNGNANFSILGYKKFFPLELSMALRRRKAGHAITSDCDPFNLYCEAAMYRIKEIAEKPKIILSLRNPVSRAYSDWNMHRYFGDRRTFESAIEDEIGGRVTRFRKRFLYQSTYEPHIRRLFNIFDRSQIMIINAEEYFANYSFWSKQLYAFLELREHNVDLEMIDRSRYKLPYASEMKEDTKVRLQHYFKAHNDRLFELLGKDYGWNDFES
jgi:sulfotransferase family protein